MDIADFKRQYYLFDPKDFGRIFVFIDFGNLRPWAKNFWPEENKFRISVEIDIDKLASICNLLNPVSKFFYYGHFPSGENLPPNHEVNIKYNNSIYRISKARKSGFTVRTKEIKMIPHYDEQGKYMGKIPKCNFDVEIAMDAIIKLDKYDTIVLFSGDSDFGTLLGYLKSKGKKIVVVSTRDRMSTELESVADKFIPAETMKNLLDYHNKTDTPPVKAEV